MLSSDVVLLFLKFSSCHGPKPPPNPEFTLKPKTKKYNRPSECTPGVPCPPCPELVWRACRGRHVGAERMVIINNYDDFAWFSI